VSVFDVGSIILVLATVVSIINERYFGLPRVIALLLGSLLLSLTVIVASHLVGGFQFEGLLQRRVDNAHLHRILLGGILALLLFASSLQANLHDLRVNAVAVFCLATIGVFISTAIFTFAIWGVVHACGLAVPIAWCFALGAILAPTDAVAVEGLLRGIPLPASLKAMIVGESLFNDGTALVVFLSALAAIAGEHNVLGHGRVLWAMLVEGGGGIAVGLATGLLACFVMRSIRDDEIAVFTSLALALGAYRLALTLGLSGPLAVVVCGIVLANGQIARGGERDRRGKINVFWSMIDSFLNTLLFVLLGFEILAMNMSMLAMFAAIAAIPVALISRFISVGLPLWLLRLTPGDTLRSTSLLTWVGLRGAISVALVLSLPAGPYNDILDAVCYAVVIFTVVVQGLLTPRVVAALYKEGV
jgi:CPA1 family monovalent cation:H+ antiporter